VLVAVPHNEGLADLAVGEGGLVIDLAIYWSVPKGGLKEVHLQQLQEDFWKLGEEPRGLGYRNYSPMVAAGFIASSSLDEFPALRDFNAALEDPIKRRDFTLSGANCDVWGVVTTEQLREEMRTPQQ